MLCACVHVAVPHEHGALDDTVVDEPQLQNQVHFNGTLDVSFCRFVLELILLHAGAKLFVCTVAPCQSVGGRGRYLFHGRHLHYKLRPWGFAAVGIQSSTCWISPPLCWLC